MGKERYWGTGGKSSRREAEGGGGGRRGGGGGEGQETKGNVSLPSGCMCAVFQWFDFHQFQFATNNTIIQHQTPPHPLPFKPNTFLSEDSPFTSGVEAPRNSLELADSSFPSIPKEVEHLDTHKKKQQTGIQVKSSIGDHKRSTSKALNRDQPSDTSCSSSDLINHPYSPGSKTPNLVARLMGLDLLPDSPSSISALVGPQSSHYHLRVTNNKQPLQPKPNDFSGTRSLPETPRISAARRSDVDHRLSLQINKENMSPGEELILSRISSTLKRKEHNLIRTEVAVSLEGKNNTSPGNLAKQIVKQVKESVSRRMGLDITNTISNKNKLDHQSRDFNAHREYSKKVLKVGSSSTCSPRLRFLDIDSKLSNKEHVNLNDVSNFIPTKPKLQEEEKEKEEVEMETRRTIKGKQSRTKRPIQTIRSAALRNKQEEPFVRPTMVLTRAIASIKPDQKKKKKKCKRMPLSNGLLTTMAPPTGLLPVKRDPTPPATKIPHRQVPNGQETVRRPQLPSSSSPSNKLMEVMHMFHVPGDINNDNQHKSSAILNISATTTTAHGPDDRVAERDYVAKVLKCNGLDKDDQVSFTRWSSLSHHPLDPTIFYELEHFNTDINNTIHYPGQLSQRCNRKLLFQLVDEILADMLRPFINLRPWVGVPIPSDHRLGRMKGSDLVDHLCMKIRSYPSVDCSVLEDIDRLIDGDLQDYWKGQRELGFEEEWEGIVSEVEKDVLDTLLHEMGVVVYCELKRPEVMGLSRLVFWDSDSVLDRKGRMSHGSFT